MRELRGGQWLAFQLQGRGTEFQYTGPELEWVAEQIRGQDVTVRYAPNGAASDLLATVVELTRGQQTIVAAEAGLHAYQRLELVKLVMAMLGLVLVVLIVLALVLAAQGQLRPHPR